MNMILMLKIEKIKLKLQLGININFFRLVLLEIMIIRKMKIYKIKFN